MTAPEATSEVEFGAPPQEAAVACGESHPDVGQPRGQHKSKVGDGDESFSNWVAVEWPQNLSGRNRAFSTPGVFTGVNRPARLTQLK